MDGRPFYIRSTAYTYIGNLSLCQRNPEISDVFQVLEMQLPEQQRPCQRLSRPCIQGILYVKQNSSIRLLVRTRLQAVQVHDWI